MKINADYFWNPEEFLTGDNIESIGEYVFDIENYLTGDHGRTKTEKSEIVLIDEQIKEINLKCPKIIFVYGHDTDRFLSNVSKIKHEFILITHNSDLGIYEKHIPYIGKNIKKWFGQNNYIKHDKVVTLPIGIARKKYSHGNVDLLSHFSKNVEKHFLCYKNFSINTNLTERTLVDNITCTNGIKMSPPCNQIEYLSFVSKSVFTISPPGNGIDCHRIWESLYLKTIPIVKFHPALECFKDLPILFVNSWNEVNIDFLKKNVNYINSHKKIDKLSFNYWYNFIKSYV